MKYNIKFLEEHKVEENIDFIVYDIEGKRYGLSRTCSFRGSSRGNYFSVICEGETIATRCKEYMGQKKIVEYLNNKYSA